MPKEKEEMRLRPFPVLQEVKFPERKENEKVVRECLEEIISRTFEEVKSQICDNYCRYTSGKDAEQIEDLWDSEICNNCPLNRL